MHRDEILRAFLTTLEDRKVSRSERKALGALLADDPPTDHDADVIEAQLFEAVIARLQNDDDRELVHALRVALGKLRRSGKPSGPPTRATRVWFGPGDPMSETLTTLIAAARQSLDVAVFTITDDRVSRELIAAHERGVRVRILTDDDKSGDRGSDAVRLQRAGLPLAFDRSPHHFHHKFAIFDDSSVLTGSYNWTRGAAHSNRENFMLTADPEAVRGYREGFEEMWRELGDG